MPHEATSTYAGFANIGTGAAACATSEATADSAVHPDAGAIKGTASSAVFNGLCEQLLAAGQSARFSASGQSMQPTILDGDILIVESLSGAAPRRGQILLVRTEGELRAHRAVCLHPRLITRGDSGLENDAPAEKVLGKIIALERAGGTISLQGPARIFTQRLRIAAHRLRQALRLRLTSLDG